MMPHAPTTQPEQPEQPEQAGQAHPVQRIAVVLLNWNAAADTLDCLAHLARWQRVCPHVWVVDNASQPADLAALRAGLTDLSIATTLLVNEENRGFAGGTNRGLRAALDVGDAPILLLNNDARLDEADLCIMLATLESRPEIGWVGPALYQGARLHSLGRRNPVLHHHTLITVSPTQEILPVGFISGSVALVRSELLREVGLLDEDYFFNTEVADLCFRAREAGYLTVVDTRARAQHNLDRSSALRSTLYTYYIIRNRFVFIAKRYRLAAWPLTGFWAGYALLLAAKLRLTGAPGPARAVYLGMVDGVTRRWGGQNARILAACGQDAA
jgi:GT2 family glycosyltransferase